jgi:hypothetical protein
MLSDKQRKKIIADFTNIQNYSEVARMNNVTDTTVKRIVSNNKEILKKIEQKKEENTKDILEYMDSIYDKQKNIIDLSLSALEEKLKNPDMFTNVKDIATVYGVIFDKALKYKEIKNKNNEGSSADINNNIINISKLINNPVENRTEENMDEVQDK